MGTPILLKFLYSQPLQSNASRDGNLALSHAAPIEHSARRLATPAGIVRCISASALPRLVNICAKCSDDSRGAYAPELRLWSGAPAVARRTSPEDCRTPSVLGLASRGGERWLQSRPPAPRRGGSRG